MINTIGKSCTMLESGVCYGQEKKQSRLREGERVWAWGGQTQLHVGCSGIISFSGDI